jgi:hypothetical protein
MTIKHINIDWEVYHKMMMYCQSAPGEISGFGKCGRMSLGNTPMYCMNDVKIFKQECGNADTELDMGALSQFIVDLDKQGESVRQWRIWWHTHNDFGVFFSGVDVATIKLLSAKRYLISICINKLGEMTARMDIGNRTTQLTIVMVPPKSGVIYESCAREVKDKVSQKRERRFYGACSYAKRKDKADVLETVGLGESVEDLQFESYIGGSRSNRKFRGDVYDKDGMLQYYGF